MQVHCINMQIFIFKLENVNRYNVNMFDRFSSGQMQKHLVKIFNT